VGEGAGPAVMVPVDGPEPGGDHGVGVRGQAADPGEAAAFAAEIAPLRVLPKDLREVLPAIASADHEFRPLAGLRAALSLVAADLEPLWDGDRSSRRADALLLTAVTPTILAALYRLRRGEQPLDPRDDLSTAANWLHMATGEVPEPGQIRAVEQYLIAAIDHGFNASTFTARVVASTAPTSAQRSSPAIGALSGPLHGGAQADDRRIIRPAARYTGPVAPQPVPA